MTGVYVPQQQQRFSSFAPSSSSGGVAGPHQSSSTMTWNAPHSAAHPQYSDPANLGSGAQQHSSPIAGPSNLINASDASMSRTLPRQVFSSPNEGVYPASTLAPVEATRARFFARQSGSSSSTSSRTRSRPTLTGSTSLPAKPARRTHKDHALSTASASAYRQSFFERCQRAMDQSRGVQRQAQVLAFRKGADGATPGLFSDDMDEDDDDELPPSSPPPLEGEERREEDDEMTRRKIIAEYQRLKRIYELKGHLEIGWIDPDQLSWLEQQQQQQQQAQEEEVMDPYWEAGDEELEQLWLESQAASQHQDVYMMQQDDEDDGFNDPELDEALAQLPC